ncbi:pimeloyl-ACP methyl ester carboxylesterase [Paraburkholderia sp. CI3]
MNSLFLRKSATCVAAALLPFFLQISPARAAGSGDSVAEAMSAKPSIVLVHGAFADGSSWDKIVPILQQKGYTVVAVQNPLSSLAEDVAATKRVIDAQPGQVVLVGHSWAGVVITEAGNNDKVKSLVYVAAFAPAEGESIADMTKDAPPPPYAKSLVPDEGGFLTLTPAAVATYFAQDLSPATARTLAATQGSWQSHCLQDKVTTAAWKTRPSWAVVARNDRMIPATFERAMAQKIGAHVTEVDSSHVAMLAKPDAVAAVIEEASR